MYHFQAVSETAIDIGLYTKAATGFNLYGHFVTFMIRLVRLLFPHKSNLFERREKNKIPWWFPPADWIKAAFIHDEWPLKWNILISNGHKLILHYRAKTWQEIKWFFYLCNFGIQPLIYHQGMCNRWSWNISITPACLWLMARMLVKGTVEVVLLKTAALEFNSNICLVVIIA